MWTRYTALCVVVTLLHNVTCDTNDSSAVISFTRRQMKKIVDEHNAIRRDVAATDMRVMRWLNTLALQAQNLTERCTWTQTPREDLQGIVQGFDQLVESTYITQNENAVDSMTSEWLKEKYNYKYETDQCNKVCWKYTQITWANSLFLGCGGRYCQRVENVEWGAHGGYLISCLYGPGGNIEGQHPYTYGNVRCSNCTSDAPYCVDGLCSNQKPTTTSTSSTTTTTTTPPPPPPPPPPETTTTVTPTVPVTIRSAGEARAASVLSAALCCAFVTLTF